MFKVCNYYRLVYNGSVVETKFASVFEVNQYIDKFFPNIPRKEFKIIPYNSGIKIEVESIKNEQINKAISKLKPYNGKGLKYNTIEPLSSYKPNQWEGREVHLAKSAEYNKGTSTLPKSKVKDGFVNDLSHFEEKIQKLHSASLSSPHHVDANTRITTLMASHPACEVYRILKGKVTLSNSELKRRIYQLTHK